MGNLSKSTFGALKPNKFMAILGGLGLGSSGWAPPLMAASTGRGGGSTFTGSWGSAKRAATRTQPEAPGVGALLVTPSGTLPGGRVVVFGCWGIRGSSSWQNGSIREI